MGCCRLPPDDPHILQYRLIYFIATIALMPLGWWFAANMRISTLPHIEKTESLIKVDWNEPIDAGVNLHRTRELVQLVNQDCLVTEAEVGIRQFMMQRDNN